MRSPRSMWTRRRSLVRRRRRLSRAGIRPLGLAAVVCLLAAIPAWAVFGSHLRGEVRAASYGNEPVALVRPMHLGFHVVRTFQAVSNLKGWILRTPAGRYDVVYTTPDGRTLISGRVLTSSGENLTPHYAALYAPRLDLNAFWRKLERRASVVVSGARHPKSVLYVVMDPNCVFCHMLWIALRRYEAVGLQVRWIPVGFLHHDSPAKAAALLKGGNPVLTQLQEKFNVRRESGGVAGITITAKLAVELNTNMALMHEAHVMGTPGIFYKDSTGRVHFRDGMPTMSELPAITGLPAQKETAPILARFDH